MDSNKTNIEHIISKVILKQATAEEIHYLQELMKEDLHVRKLYFKTSQQVKEIVQQRFTITQFIHKQYYFIIKGEKNV